MKYLFTGLLLSSLLLFVNAKIKAQEPTKPRLIVGIVIDQMLPEYLYRYQNNFGNGGFRRLLNEGFECQNTHYNYVPTYTGPGHACVYTGTTPSVNGIVANDWYNRKTKNTLYCTEDTSMQTVGTKTEAGRMSPKNLLTTTITDELRLFSNLTSKVIAVALKDRGSILPAGHLGKAYWYDPENGNFITSTHYATELPQWVSQFNKKQWVRQLTQKNWDLLLSKKQYQSSLGDDNLYEGLFEGEKKPTFPHNLSKWSDAYAFSAIRATPFGNTLTKEFAIAALKSNELGKNNATDFLAISFSSTDYVGHKYGTRALETEDTYIRLDRDIEELLNELDLQVGKGNYLLFLTADHGANEVPDFLNDNKVPAGLFDDKQFAKQLKSYLFQTYRDSLVENFINQQVYLDHNRIAQLKLNLNEVQQQVVYFAQQHENVVAAYTSTDLLGCASANYHKQLTQNGYYLQRSGDVALIYPPAWMEYEHTGTSHGSSYSYDTHVPLLWYGWRIQPGKSATRYHVTDIAPTIATWLHTAFPNGCTGNPIVEIGVR